MKSLERSPGHAWAALLALFGWLRWPSWLWIPVALVALAAGWLHGRWRGLPATLLTLLLGLASVVAAVGLRSLTRIGNDWPTFWAAEEERAGEALQQRMEALIAEGNDALAVLSRGSAGDVPEADVLDQLRRRSGLSALAVYDPAGVPLVWSGLHHGPVPERVRTGARSYDYGESPLFGYLYFTLPREAGDGTAVGAVLLRADLPRSLASEAREDFSSRFEVDTGEEIRITTVERVQGPGVWDFRWQEETLFSMQVVRPAQAERQRDTFARWSRWVLGLAILAWLFLVRVSPPARRVRIVAVAVALVAGFLPFDRLFGAFPFFSPADYLLPGPLPFSLGRVLLIVGAAALLLGVAGLPSARWGVWIAGVGGGIGLPLLTGWLGGGVSTSILAGPEPRWIVYAMVLSTAATVWLVLAFSLGRPRRGDRGVRLGWLALALVANALAGLGLAARVQFGLAVPALWLGAWAPGLALASAGLGSREGRHRLLLTVAVAGVLAASAVAPFVWSQRTHARMEVAETEMRHLGSASDPYVEFLLERLGEELWRLQPELERPIELLYEAWESSGLSEVEAPIWLTLWTEDNLPREVLPIGVGTAAPVFETSELDRARTATSSLIRRVDRPEVLYLATYPLRDGMVGSAVLPPRRDVAGASPLGPLFSGVERTGRGPLSLVPLGDDEPGAGEAVDWYFTNEGLTGERIVRFPEGDYRARYRLALAGPFLMVVRGTLLLALALGLAGILFGLGASARTRPGRLGIPWTGVVTSFRGRVTLALFGFFLLSTLVIGVLALQTLSRAADRTAEALATRGVEEAAEAYPGPGRALGPLATQIGADLLLYRDGALLEGAVLELVELGIYPGWLPIGVHRSLAEGRTLTSSVPGRLGGWQYVMAYRALGGGRVLASPASLQVGATALRRRETLDVLGFTILLGGALSLALAFLVGRTLTRPIETLRVASERVGAGNLETRLTEERDDEFGTVFQAFNRMVARLRATREALTRTTRRTQAIVEEAATGVIALDPEGRVVLVNPRAEGILGTDLVLGETVPGDRGERAAELGRWIERFFEDGLPEGTVEFSFGERRVRVRGRRISRAEPLGGAVFSLADVTDEMRAERVLAWGEMARQIAHEVKNPLTPIKLGVQHLQRAWRDGADDYGNVLERNANAILTEIDRLAQIAGSFSRFSAPGGEGGGAPIERVELAPVVADLLALYETSDRGVQFRSTVPDGLPPVQARESELKEVLVNLLENAREAVGSEGRVEVRAAALPGQVELAVVDDGVGISEADLARVFEPRFSTRSRGTGLGLAIVRRLIESWGGSVEAESELGRGTTIRMTLLPWAGEAETGGSRGEARA
ncbi:MAG: ATP-binding protein [Gemmatimonadota bacterium]